MILVDTSAWIAFFRDDGDVADAVDRALYENEVALCGPVVTELRRGLRSKKERQRVLPLLDGCSWLDEPEHLWQDAGDLGFVLARKGVTVKTLDLLIACHALSHRVALLAQDRDFGLMVRKGVPLQLL